MEKEIVLGERHFVIHDFLSAEECESFIALSEQRGYEAAPINSLYGATIREDVRNNTRVLFDDAALAGAWFERLAPLLPERIGTWKAIGLNERFRFYRYDPEQSFKRHYDGSYSRLNGEESLLTFMIYLNEGYEGGATAFYSTDNKLFRKSRLFKRPSPLTAR